MNHMNNNTAASARNTKVMNRFDLTTRLVAKLKQDEAVVGGIGNTNFDLWAAGQRRQRRTALERGPHAAQCLLGTRNAAAL